MKTALFLGFFLAFAAFAAVILLFVFADHEETRTFTVGQVLIWKSTSDRSYGPDWLIPIVTVIFTLPVALVCLATFVIQFREKAVPKPISEEERITEETAKWVKSALILSKGMQIITQSPFGIRAALAEQVYGAETHVNDCRDKTIEALTSALEQDLLKGWASELLSLVKQGKPPSDVKDKLDPSLSAPDGNAKPEEKAMFAKANEAIRKAKDAVLRWERWTQSHSDLRTALQSFDRADSNEALQV